MGMEIKELKDVESGEDGIAYLRFSNMPVVRSVTFADGEVNVDFDAYDDVVGIEMLSSDAAELHALAEIVTKYALSLDALRYAKK